MVYLQFWISLFCSKKNGLETNTLACPQPAVRRTLGDDALLATSSSWWLCIRATTHLRPAVGRLTSSPFWKGRTPPGTQGRWELLTVSSRQRGQVWLEICSFLKSREDLQLLDLHSNLEIATDTLPPIITVQWKMTLFLEETSRVGTHSPLPWLWEEGYYIYSSSVGELILRSTQTSRPTVENLWNLSVFFGSSDRTGSFSGITFGKWCTLRKFL